VLTNVRSFCAVNKCNRLYAVPGSNEVFNVALRKKSSPTPVITQKHSLRWIEVRCSKCWPKSSLFERYCKERSATAQNVVFRPGNVCLKSSRFIQDELSPKFRKRPFFMPHY